MTDKEKAELKNEMSEIIKSRIKEKEQAERNELKDLFKNNLPTLTELIEELKQGQVINVYPSGQIFTSGLKFKSFDTYSKFIDGLNEPKDRSRNKTETINDNRQPTEIPKKNISTAEWIMIVLADVAIIVTIIYSN